MWLPSQEVTTPSSLIAKKGVMRNPCWFHFLTDIAKIKTNQKNNKNNKNTFMLRKWLQLAVWNWFGPKKS
jgi:hypothetical protein